ncbi:MAG: type II toxin-antitoxin system RelE/ParE family toxin [Proteobacteria bacterium]|nr:type II toxin-antitoxin system RelE/ParE family toxin [Pseudomonadota bacterium]
MADGGLRPLKWVGDSRTALGAMPKAVRGSFGIRLYRLQKGEAVRDSKALPQLGSGVFELREAFDKNAYRLMYVLKLKKAIYVLHVFMKKSKSGIGLPKPDAALIAKRLRDARRIDGES